MQAPGWERIVAGIWAVTAYAALVGSASLGESCWRGEYDEHRCCVQEDPSCWDAVFTPALCCPAKGAAGRSEVRGRGDPRCWLDGYTFEDCCRQEPKAGCWDSEFTAERCCADAPPDAADRPLNVTEEEMTAAFFRITTAAGDGPLGCDDAPRGLWRRVKVASAALDVSRRYGMPGDKPAAGEMEEMVRHVLSWVDDGGAWELARAACPAGALDAIDLSVAHIDRELGEDRARQAYGLHQALRLDLVARGAWPPAGDWPLLGEGFEYVPKLLGLSPRHSCYGSSLRIYVYKLPKLTHMLKPVITCSQKMSQCTASVHMHRWLEGGSCLTDDPDQADLFYVPAYEACYNETACGFGEDTERCFPQDFDPAVDLPYFSRHQGSDHVFVFGCNLLPLRDPLMLRARQSIMVTVESYQAENFAGPNMLAWLSHWKDVLIPGYIPRWRIEAMLAFNRPMIQRPLLVAFHGHSSRNPSVGHMYKRSPLAEVRDRVIGYFWSASLSSVGPPVRDYFRRMGRSRFCLVPAGLTAWTIHLYEAFFLGCIPVILSDELTVPFQAEVDWPSLSLHVPAGIDMALLHEKLANFSLGRLKSMYRALAAARCWFDYSLGWGGEAAGAGGCSPFRATLSALEERSRARGRLYGLGRFWEPAPTA